MPPPADGDHFAAVFRTHGIFGFPQSQVRKTLREAILMHAVSRFALHSFISKSNVFGSSSDKMAFVGAVLCCE